MGAAVLSWLWHDSPSEYQTVCWCDVWVPVMVIPMIYFKPGDLEPPGNQQHHPSLLAGDSQTQAGPVSG
ncbi:hypothetical protein DYI20_06565 [Auritidibacter ignavus]|nr:hypothetical protein [Auritidibacter ignavus]PXA77734.1 hypothetical protein DCC24_02095 [Auritidibacter sp. NML100628]RMX23032.1 hypothetical protein DYI20_06565 [Auritidibacter ignavus]